MTDNTEKFSALLAEFLEAWHDLRAGDATRRERDRHRDAAAALDVAFESLRPAKEL